MKTWWSSSKSTANLSSLWQKKLLAMLWRYRGVTNGLLELYTSTEFHLAPPFLRSIEIVTPTVSLKKNLLCTFNGNVWALDNVNFIIICPKVIKSRRNDLCEAIRFFYCLLWRLIFAGIWVRPLVQRQNDAFLKTDGPSFYVIF